MAPDRASLRHRPQQRRSNDRVDQLVDAAAAIVDEVGTTPLTTTLVAERAGAGVGTVYRYFPDRIALLQGIADRNARQLLERMGEVVAVGREDLASELVALFHAYVDVYRTMPGFRTVRAGEALPDAKRKRGELIDAVVGVVLGVVGPRHGVVVDDALRESLAACIHVVDALVGIAFLEDVEGDERALAIASDVAAEIGQRIVARHPPRAQRQG